jgi:hypothetical protein
MENLDHEYGQGDVIPLGLMMKIALILRQVKD